MVVKQNLPFWLLTVALFVAFMVTNLAMQGLGGDGVVYAAIAWNMAHGIGSFWQPHYLAPFYEHPPLAFYLESVFFSVFGDHFWIEKLYSGLAALVSILATIKLWKLSARTSSNSLVSWHWAWLPFLLWMTVADNLDAYKNNLLENTLICFALWATVILMTSVVQNRKRFISLVGAAILLVAALITKGPQCLFVLSSILLYWLVFRRISFWQAIYYTALLVGLVALFLGLILCYKPAYHDLHQYWLQQFWATVSGGRPGPYVGWAHSYVLWLLFQNLIPLILLTPLVLFIHARQQYIAYKTVFLAALTNRWFIFYFTLGLLASLPVMFSSRLQDPYILQSFPFFILAFAQILTPIIVAWVQKIKLDSNAYRRFRLISLLLLTVALVNVILSYGKVGRHNDLLSDVLILERVIPHNSLVTVNPSVTDNADIVQAYFYRYFQVALTTSQQCHYYLVNKTDTAPAGYTLYPIALNQLNLYQNPNKHCDAFSPSL